MSYTSFERVGEGRLELVADPTRLVAMPSMPSGFPSLTWYQELEQIIEGFLLANKVPIIDLSRNRSDVEVVGAVALRWAAPRVIVGGRSAFASRIFSAIERGEEPLPAWSLWRHAWDGKVDLALRGHPAQLITGLLTGAVAEIVEAAR